MWQGFPNDARVKRRMLNVATALSLLLCVAVVVLWIRSHRTSSVFGYYTDRGSDGWYRNFYFASYRGRVTFVSLRQKFADQLPRGRFHAWDDETPSPQPGTEFAGFGHFHVQGREMGWTEIRVPYWSVVLAAATAPVTTAAGWLRRRGRRKPGVCPSCGYDLRATPDRCPECGAAASVIPSA